MAISDNGKKMSHHYGLEPDILPNGQLIIHLNNYSISVSSVDCGNVTLESVVRKTLLDFNPSNDQHRVEITQQRDALLRAATILTHALVKHQNHKL